MEPRVRPARRARTVLSALALDAQAIARPGYSVLLGRCLLVVTGVVVSVPMPLLHLSTGQTFVVARLTAAMVSVLLVSFKVPWGRLPRNAVLAFPISVMTGLAALGFFAGAPIGTCFTGLFVLCFAYIGVCGAARTVLWILPVALPAYVATVDTWSTNIVIRVADRGQRLDPARRAARPPDRASSAWSRRRSSGLSRTDELTRLANRRDLDARLAAPRVGDTVVMCDLDHFKELNDTLGHAAGDVVLRDFGTVMLSCLRGDDYAARYGGEEFVLILAETDADQTVDVLVRLRRRWAGVHPEITFSAGYADPWARSPPSAVARAAPTGRCTPPRTPAATATATCGSLRRCRDECCLSRSVGPAGGMWRSVSDPRVVTRRRAHVPGRAARLARLARLGVAGLRRPPDRRLSRRATAVRRPAPTRASTSGCMSATRRARRGQPIRRCRSAFG